MHRTSCLAFVWSALLAVPGSPQDGGFLEAAKFTIPTSQGLEQMGRSVAAADSAIAVGVPGIGLVGAVYVFEAGPQGWTGGPPIAVLTPSDGVLNGDFGESVAMTDDVIVVGATRATAAGVTGAGAVYVFERPVGGWTNATEDAKLEAANPVTFDGFGKAVAIDEVIVVGAPDADGPTGVETGTVSVFEPAAGRWTSGSATVELSPSDIGPGIQFGFGVATSGTTILVGAPSTRGFLGGAYVFEKPAAGGWASGNETVRLWASNPTLFDRFGTRVALAGRVAIVGAPAGLQVNPIGQAYVFERPFGGWQAGTETHILTDDEAGAGFGAAVGVGGGMIVVGAPNATLGQPGARGAMYVYRAQVPWMPLGRTSASDGQALDSYGFALAVADQQIAIGAPGVDLAGGAALAGSAYVVDFGQRALATGCGSRALTLSGSRRLGGTMEVSMVPCAAGSAHALVLGVPLAQPFWLSPALSCEPVLQCRLTCSPLVNLPGPNLSVAVPIDPAYLGVTLCWQGLCVEPTVCARITDRVSATFSR